MTPLELTPPITIMEKNPPSSAKTISKNDLASVEAPASGWSASQYNKAASFVYSSSYVAPVLELLDAKPGERIFDFGCGSGEVTLQIVETVGKNGLVVGVDYSESMVSRNLFSTGACWHISLVDRESEGQRSSACIRLRCARACAPGIAFMGKRRHVRYSLQ